MSCPHPALLNGLCVACGQFIAQAEQDLHLLWGSELTLTGGTQLRLSNAERHRMEAAKVSSLRSNRKLALVLDLDHTLLHSILVDGPFLPELNGKVAL